MASPSSVLTLGMGTWSDSTLITLGFGVGVVALVAPYRAVITDDPAYLAIATDQAAYLAVATDQPESS